MGPVGPFPTMDDLLSHRAPTRGSTWPYLFPRLSVKREQEVQTVSEPERKRDASFRIASYVPNGDGDAPSGPIWQTLRLAVRVQTDSRDRYARSQIGRRSHTSSVRRGPSRPSGPE